MSQQLTWVELEIARLLLQAVIKMLAEEKTEVPQRNGLEQLAEEEMSAESLLA